MPEADLGSAPLFEFKKTLSKSSVNKPSELEVDESSEEAGRSSQ